MEKDDFLCETREALGEGILRELQNLSFCIAGCGAVGSLFAEMLVRTGAREINLIDGDYVELANLNCATSFTKYDVDQLKVEVLEKRLKSIVPAEKRLIVRPRAQHLMKKNDDEGHNLIVSSDVVIIAMNTNRARVLCEHICRDNERRYISIGVEINRNGKAYYECAWRPKTNPDAIHKEGYGFGSYASIVMEATSVGFGMLLSHLQDPGCNNIYTNKKYEGFISCPP